MEQATVIENGIVSASSAITIDQDAIADAVKRMTDVIDCARAAVEDSDADDETLANMDAKELKAIQQSLSGIIKEGRAALTDFNRAFDAPKKIVKAAFDDATSDITALQARYKAQQDANVRAEKEEKRRKLEAHFYEYAGVLDGVVQYDMIHDEQWLNKTFSLSKAYAEIENAVENIARGYESIKKLNVSYRDVAEREFFATLDINMAIAAATEAEERQARIDAFEADLSSINGEAEPVETDQPAESVEKPVDPSQDRAPEPRPAVVEIQSATDEQLGKLAAFMAAEGMHGRIRRPAV